MCVLYLRLSALVKSLLQFQRERETHTERIVAGVNIKNRLMSARRFVSVGDEWGGGEN